MFVQFANIEQQALNTWEGISMYFQVSHKQIPAQDEPPRSHQALAQPLWTIMAMITTTNDMIDHSSWQSH